MKKRQKKSQLASALQITISIALISMSVMLVIAANTRTGPIASNSANTSLTESLSIAENRLTVLFPKNWSTAKEGNVNKLFRVSKEELQNLSRADFNKTPQVLIFTEKRKSHAEAVQRLREIAQEFHAPANYLSIGGWPALQRRYTAPREQPGGEEDERVEGSAMVLHLTTAIAAGDLLVRFEGRLEEDASPDIVQEVDAISGSPQFSEAAQPDRTNQEIQELRQGPQPSKNQVVTPLPSILAGQTGITEPSGGQAGAVSRVSNAAGRDSELEVAVSTNGRNIVVGSNTIYSFSLNGGQTFGPSNIAVSNDPSLAFGQSGSFYAANISTPSTRIDRSTDNGQNFSFRGNAFTCPGPGPNQCGAAFPDQEHIVADRFNAAPGGDQLYSAWRQLNGSVGIVCSADGGANWTATADFQNGDLPRVGINQDGTVYMIWLSGNNIMLARYRSCENDSANMANNLIGTSTIATGVNPVACPIPGIDRCNGRNTLASPIVAVDDTNGSHLYAAYATNTVPGGANCANQNTCNENVIVRDSTDGGVTWPDNSPGVTRVVAVNSGIIARRFMPWLAVMGGVAHVSWYDRRLSNNTNNDLTDFYRGRTFLNGGGNLQVGSEIQVNQPGTADTQCEAGFPVGSVNSWPGGTDNMNDSTSCSMQPQLAGRCGTVSPCCTPPDSNQPCDFNTGPACPVGETCRVTRGSPKYGDYNGSAAAAGRFYNVWASAISPPGITPPSTDIDIFFSSRIVCCVPQIQVPSNPTFPDTCVGSTSTTTLNICNTGAEDLEVASITSNNPQFVVTAPSSGFPVVISPDSCFPFEVRFTPTSPGPKTATLTINSDDPVNPSVTVQASGNGTQQAIAVTGSTTFGDVCPGTSAERTVSVCNVGACDLHVTGASLSCPDFTLVNNPFPATVSHDSCVDLVIRFTPTSPGPKSCTLTITSDDPNNPVINLTVTGNTPAASIDVPLDATFPPTVIQSIGSCHSGNPFPISNTGSCNLTITNITISGTNAGDYSLAGLPSFPIILEPGHIVGEGDLSVVFSPTAVARERRATINVTYESNPITHTTTTVTRMLCGEGVKTGARVLVEAAGVPLPSVKKIQLQRLTVNKDSDVVHNAPLQTVTPTLPCIPFQFHREYGTVSNPIQLLTGSYQVTVQATINGHNLTQTAAFELGTCDFNPNVVVNFP